MVTSMASTSGDYGLAGFAVDGGKPLEEQARGFTHGHCKVYGIPEALGPEVLQQFRALSAAQPEAPESATTAFPLSAAQPEAPEPATTTTSSPALLCKDG